MKLAVWSFAVLLSAGAAVVTSDDLDAAFQNLKQAEAQKDFAALKKLATELFALTRQVTSTPAPEDAAQKEAWTNRVAFARDAELHAEYALSAAAFQAPASVTIELLSTLEQQNPKSKYLGAAYARYLVALNETGAASKIPAVAEKAIANFPDNEDVLLVLADSALNRKQSANALTYSRRLVAVLNRHPRPEEMSAADWERKKTAALGRGYWIAGMVLSEKSQHFEADKNLRAALPLIQGNEAMLAPTLYYLGVANYQLGKMTLNKAQVLEAVKFSERAAALQSPYTEHARHNALVMKNDADRMR
jgi:tetratricopeptide (TPR) repeat protein